MNCHNECFQVLCFCVMDISSTVSLSLLFGLSWHSLLCYSILVLQMDLSHP